MAKEAENILTSNYKNDFVQIENIRTQVKYNHFFKEFSVLCFILTLDFDRCKRLLKHFKFKAK